ncbi:sigma-54-dependent Fis family transcriptional regulator [Caldimonas thermodepolymerans]|mgnify:FL=1|uniref:Sigma-54-dependent Fis family transcriptional regulator n=1 Tax=Caldimonas thermodepolymerans TaxID=215580 RepID=A0A2S5T265_9BURK|nr:sigma-54-dependent Fis family transcriptional regulator [Caldimonas thermodepolymerans]PPE69111.1 sigma-54-dependent Fis family transcriptional regulator [Caldimonas thermodepolymerans]QPC32063.1 sigma-54-dependent Fis family transcriptional regulator [Caldimonas thermodepolymerans]RDH95924.1 transcriptional regulator of acetoin/glycerol metabolism [Caldimonas thermodepolymerans]
MSPAPALAPRPSAQQLREARHQLLDTGAVTAGLIDPALQASWQRSRAFGLAPRGRMPGMPHASAAQLARALEHRHALVSQARPVMEFLSEQIRGTDSIVFLADSQGMLLCALGDDGFAERAARVALRPGAIWHEQWRGTNAIGTALVEEAAVVVHGAEHYLERNSFLTCAASPIVDPAGQTIGVLDISGGRRSHHCHTLGLVRSGARMIEHQLFEARYGGGLQLRLHTRPEGIGSVTEGLLAVSEDGWLVGANAAALAMLGLPRGMIGAVTAERVLGIDLAGLLAASGRTPRLLRSLPREDGGALWVRLDTGRGSALAVSVRPVAAPAPAADALAALDRGDGTMQAVVARARRVVDKPIALLLQGESGVGKEVFARACHASGPRQARPFVAVNCAALPETLIEAELFGYRPGAYTGAGREGSPGRIREADGGTLFLDEIGDMPLALQARLLRVLQERQVVPLGGGQPVAVDFQLVCATHRRLRDEVAAGRFREDLYYRINGLTLQLPPLRERTDLPALVDALLQEVAPGQDMQLAPEVAAAFGRYRWPGNLRQLANVLRTACALAEDGDPAIGWAQLPDDIAEELNRPAAGRELHDADTDLRQQAARAVQQAVQAAHGNLSEAARRLGISRNTLYRKLRELKGLA